MAVVACVGVSRLICLAGVRSPVSFPVVDRLKLPKRDFLAPVGLLVGLRVLSRIVQRLFAFRSRCSLVLRSSRVPLLSGGELESCLIVPAACPAALLLSLSMI